MALPKGTPRPCKGCGTTIYRLKFCTSDCRTDWYARTCAERSRERDRARGIRAWDERYPTTNTAERECQHCGRSFTRRKRPDDAATHCSRECAFNTKRAAAEVRGGIRREASIYKRWAEQAKRGPKGNRCRDCGRRVLKSAQRCPACRANAFRVTKLNARNSDAGKAARRRAKARRRAVERGIKAERFDPFEIFDRDKWRCHLCGVKTPKRLRGTYEDNAPELDHVVPLAAGGEHTRRNCACSCRRCNIEKADRPLGQLRLVA